MHNAKLTGRSRFRFALVAGITLLALLVSACGGSKPAAKEAPAASTSKEFVFFGWPSSHPWLNKFYKQLKKDTERLGYTAKIFENDWTQPTMDLQVQQHLASGEKPALYLWWPSDNKAGLASLKKLHATGVPVIQINERMLPEGEQYVVAFAGVDHQELGQIMGKLIVEGRDQLKKNGVKLHGEGGNLINLGFWPGFTAHFQRLAGIEEAIAGTGISILDTQYAGTDAAKGYEIGSQMITAKRAKGIDLVIGFEDGLAQGAVQALEEAGYKPGKDVMVVGGNCDGAVEAMKNGKQFADVMQSPSVEATTVMITVHRFLKNKTVKPGVQRLAFDAEKQPSDDGDVYRYNFDPLLGVHNSEMNTAKIWGHTYAEECE